MRVTGKKPARPIDDEELLLQQPCETCPDLICPASPCEVNASILMLMHMEKNGASPAWVRMVLFNNFAMVIKVLWINEPAQPMNDKLPDSQVISLLQNELESIDTVFFGGFVFSCLENTKMKNKKW